MSKFSVPTKENVSAENQAIFNKLQGALGFVPNLYATIAYSDHALGKYLAFQNARTTLNNKEKEAVNLVVSEVNGCKYCQSAHTVIGKMNGFTDDDVLELRGGKSNNAKLDTLVKLAKDITENKGRVAETNLNAFYNAGYTNANLVDLVMQISDKIAMNYLHNLTQIPIDFPVAEPLKAIPA